ncbi:MAG: replicative DNA helicase [Candidatus Marinimicrobia bacterium]|nr:replicative DNA helicase [Candidatus Neomarinimicrobiota bacterium]
MTQNTDIHLNIQPHSDEAEQAVLGSILRDEKSVSKVLQILTGTEFYNDQNKILFKAMLGLCRIGETIDTVSLVDQLKKDKQLETVGGAYYITGLEDATPTSANVTSHANIVWQKYMLRCLIVIGDELQKKAYEDSIPPNEILIEAEKIIFKLADHHIHSGFTGIKDSLLQVLDNLDAIHCDKNKFNGITSGFMDLDSLINGFQKGDLIILAGRPGMGKTAFAINCARNSGVPAAVFSLEMSKRQLTNRVLLAEARVDSHKARAGHLSKDEFTQINSSAVKVEALPIYIDDNTDVTVAQVRSMARRIKTEKNVRLFIIDYLQLMNEPSHNESRNQEISLITRSLKGMAKELNVPVILLSQLSRSCEKRKNKRPILSDLRDSGSIEQDADLVMFLYRQAYYDRLAGKAPQDNTAECIIAKNRNGPTGKVKLTFIENYTRFENYVQSEQIAMGTI